MLRSSAAALSAFLVLAMPAAADPVADARAETVSHLARGKGGIDLCFPPLSGPVEVHAVRITKQGELATDHKTLPFHYADLRVEATAQPALIILGSYGPTIWRIDAAPKSRIAAVVMAGHNEPLITGLPDGIPVTRGYYRTRLDEVAGCGKLPLRDAPEEVRKERLDIKYALTG